MAFNIQLTQKLDNGTYEDMNPMTLATLIKLSEADPTVLTDKLSIIEAVAKGATNSKVFDTLAALNTWVGVAANKATLKVGDNLYIKEKEVPDYWWDGTAIQELETQRVVLSNATASADGLMSKSDKSKLDGIATGANKTNVVNSTSSTSTTDAAAAAAVKAAYDLANSKAGTAVSTTSANGLMSSTDKTKLDGIAANAEVNQNAFSIIKVGATNIEADSKTDTLELVAGSNITLTPDATNDKITIAATNTVYTHPTGDGNLHVPATGTSNNGKVLKAGSTAGSLSWGTLAAADVGAVPTTRKINGKALSADIALSASDVVAEPILNTASEKITLMDADTMPLSDSAASNATRKITFENIKVVLKTYFDTLYNKISASTTTPKANGTAATGTEEEFARGDHVHPLQTTVSGNAGTATKLATARTIQTNLASTASASFNGSANATPGVTGTLSVANGGTGATTAAAALTALGAEAVLNTAIAKTTLVDADTMPLSDSAASNATKKITFAHIKAVLKTYFDTLYNKVTVVNSTSSTSTTDAAAAAAVKTAYDLANTANTTANSKAGTAVATTSVNGLMSSTDKSKLDGVAAGANKTTVTNSVTSTSTTNAAAAAAVKLAYDLANTANVTANSKLDIIISATEPVGQAVGGLWFKRV